jgi:hypothetical protein
MNHEAISRRAPISLSMIVARTHMYAAKVWDLSIVQGPLLSPRAKPFTSSIRNILSSLCIARLTYQPRDAQLRQRRAQQQRKRHRQDALVRRRELHQPP